MRSHQSSERMKPTKPTAMRIQPTASTLTLLLESWLTANVRIAPTAIRIRLTGTPTRALWPPCIKEKLAGDTRVVAARVAVPGGVLLERPDREPGAGDGGDDLAEPP